MRPTRPLADLVLHHPDDDPAGHGQTPEFVGDEHELLEVPPMPAVVTQVVVGRARDSQGDRCGRQCPHPLDAIAADQVLGCIDHPLRPEQVQGQDQPGRSGRGGRGSLRSRRISQDTPGGRRSSPGLRESRRPLGDRGSWWRRLVSSRSAGRGPARRSTLLGWLIRVSGRSAFVSDRRRPHARARRSWLRPGDSVLLGLGRRTLSGMPCVALRTRGRREDAEGTAGPPSGSCTRTSASSVVSRYKRRAWLSVVMLIPISLQDVRPAALEVPPLEEVGEGLAQPPEVLDRSLQSGPCIESLNCLGGVDQGLVAGLGRSGLIS